MATLHPPVDEYLRAILELGEEGNDVIQARLAERLHVSAPSVSEMVKRLGRDGYLRGARGRIELTAAGRTYAEKIVRRHRLAELLLIDVLGLDWSLAHEEASKFEHVISDAVEERIIAVLDGPTTCPHGNPIPGLHDGSPEKATPLAGASEGEVIVLRRVTEDVEIDFDTLRYLDKAGFIPGRTATVVDIAPDGSILLEVSGRSLAIGADLARHLFVDVA